LDEIFLENGKIIIHYLHMQKKDHLRCVCEVLLNKSKGLWIIVAWSYSLLKNYVKSENKHAVSFQLERSGIPG